jgi:hypothetical protein
MAYLLSKVMLPHTRFDEFLVRTLTAQGFDVVPGFRVLGRPWHNQTGWVMNYVDVDWHPETLLLVHASDFVTVTRDGQVVELQNLEQHYGSRSSQILFTHWERDLAKFYQGPINLCWWSNHNYDTVLQACQRSDEWLPQLKWPRSQHWQCLNGRIMRSRQLAAEVLHDWPGGWLSLGDEIPLPSFSYQTYKGTDNDENLVRLMYIYGDTYVNIVTETKFDEPTGIITEKTLQACMTEQVPILIGHRSIHAHARDMGIDLLEDLVDLSYANAPGYDRVRAAIECNRDLILGHIDLEPYRDRLRRQREYVMYELPEVMRQRFRDDAQVLARRLLPAQHGHESI